MSVLRTGRGRAGGGGGEVEFLTEKKFPLRNEKFQIFFSLLNFFFQKCSWGSETHANKKLFFGGGGGILGCLGRPTRGVGKRYTSSYDHDM